MNPKKKVYRIIPVSMRLFFLSMYSRKEQWITKFLFLSAEPEANVQPHESMLKRIWTRNRTSAIRQVRRWILPFWMVDRVACLEERACWMDNHPKSAQAMSMQRNVFNSMDSRADVDSDSPSRCPDGFLTWCCISLCITSTIWRSFIYL